jgi:acetyl-CoA carboxylase carboxyl transferase subunit beta
MKIKFPFSRRSAPADAWTKCPRCEGQLFNRQLERNQRVCPTCDHHFRLSAPERIELLVDSGSFVERDAGLVSGDPLGFTDSKPYPERLESSRARSGLAEAAIWGMARIEGQPVALGLFDFRFMGGSMGSVVGEKMARCFEGALAERVPAIIVSASGGARMQEGTVSLLQLAKTTAALGRLNEAGIPFISILTDPTTGGVLASFASLGDVILAEPGALIGFAGARVASGTVGEELPEGFQSAERLLDRGFVDAIVPRNQLRTTVARLLRVLPVNGVTTATDGRRAMRPIGALQGLAQRVGGVVSEGAGIDTEAPTR